MNTKSKVTKVIADSSNMTVAAYFQHKLGVRSRDKTLAEFTVSSPCGHNCLNRKSLNENPELRRL